MPIILPADVSESRDVVFSPNLVNSPTFGTVYRSFMRKRGWAESWTCKKAATPGDLYLFYFGQPEFKIAGLAVCRDFPDPAGWKERQWTNRQRMFFCPMDALYHFGAPVTADDLRTSGFSRVWWKTRPYHGRPKTIPSNVAVPLLRAIAKREPEVAGLLNGYIDERKNRTAIPKAAALMAAWEGTRYERLAKDRARSQDLRDAKIRQSMDSKGHLFCEVPGCGFDFLTTYGELGRKYAHVHHRLPLAARYGRHTKLAALAIVCANCHAMIHRFGKCRPLEGLISDDD